MSLFNLESKKILLDFRYAKEELNIKKEMIEEMNGLFNKAVSEYLQNDIELKTQWDLYLKKSDDNISKILDLQKFEGDVYKIEDNNESIQEVFEIEETIESELDNFLRHVYREIVKKTHPDKTTHLSEEERNVRDKLYLDATVAYEIKSLADILYCAYILKIPFEINKDYVESLKDSLQRCKMESIFLEKTYTWQWYHVDEIIKQELIFKFVKHSVK